MLQKPDVKYQYSDTEQYYGNDCLITLVVTVIEVDSVYIATCAKIVSGWSDYKESISEVFRTSYTDAVNYCERFMKTHGLF